MPSTGDNSIIIIGGANQAYENFELPDAWKHAIENADVLLMQREIPDDVNLLATKVLKSDAITFLDVGGNNKSQLPDELLQRLDYISPNETELKIL